MRTTALDLYCDECAVESESLMRHVHHNRGVIRVCGACCDVMGLAYHPTVRHADSVYFMDRSKRAA